MKENGLETNLSLLEEKQDFQKINRYVYYTGNDKPTGKTRTVYPVKNVFSRDKNGKRVGKAVEQKDKKPWNVDITEGDLVAQKCGQSIDSWVKQFDHYVSLTFKGMKYNAFHSIYFSP